MQSYYTPRDKLVCILNCCKRINASLFSKTCGTHGADEFFPLLIYVVLQVQSGRYRCVVRKQRHSRKMHALSAFLRGRSCRA